jgi:chaperone BCS1
VLEYFMQKKDMLKLDCVNLRAFISPFQEDKQADVFGNRLKVIPDLMFMPEDGVYPFQYNGQKMFIVYYRSEQVHLTSTDRKIDFLKSVKIECEGESVEPIKQFINDAIKGFGQSNLEDMMIYENLGGAWIKSKNKRSRTMESVILDKEISERVLEDLKEFVDSEEWYKKMGVPYRRCYLLYGPPGTGKSSFTQALAGHMKYSICFVNVSDNMTDFNFNNLLNNAPKKSVILLEDVDAMFEGRKNK